MKSPNKLSKLIKTVSLPLFVGIPFLATLLFAAPTNAWGPERPTFTMENPATYPVFNSITNNPTIGDERDFVRIGEIGAKTENGANVTELTNDVAIIPGRQYLVYIYFHNNASSTFNDSAHNHSGVAIRTRLASAFSTVLTPSAPGTVSATITADNSNPTSVWDEARMTTTYEKVYLNYVSGSSRIYNDWRANNSVLSTSLFTEGGTLLGLNELNGVIPGCEEYHGIVTYVLQAEEMSGTIDKSVSTDGTNYGVAASISPNEEVTFKLTIANTGDLPLTNATVRDNLPAGLELIPGTTKLSANNSGTWDQLSDGIALNGFNLGTIGTGNTVEIIYRARATGDFDCSGTELTNSATLTYDSETSAGDTKADSATVVVTATNCAPVETCETNPNLDGCTAPVPPESETCATNPNLPGCQTIPNTGPVEIIMAIVIVLGIAGAGFYFFRTHRTLRTVEKSVHSGKPDQSTPAEGTTVKDSTPSRDDSQNGTPSATENTPSGAQTNSQANNQTDSSSDTTSGTPTAS